jgi:3-methyladenine DNA glycosylase AlkD
MNAPELIHEIRTFCRANADPAIVQKYARYFKEGYNGYGLPAGVFMAKVKELLGSGSLGMDIVLEASRELIAGEKYEEPSFAMQLLKGFSKQFSRETFFRIEAWFPIGIRNWAHTDGLCSELLTPMLMKGIFSMEDLSGWRSSSFPFQRRAVPVCLIKQAKKCSDIHPYLDFLDPMMKDKERVVHQGLGWFLREAWKVHPGPVEAFLLKWKEDAARLIFQYATEKMAKEERGRFRRENQGRGKI